MNSESEPARRSIDRVASRFVLLVLGLGCLVFWAVIPTGGIWLGGKIGNDFAQQLILTLGIITAGMLVMSMVLGWLNELYLRTTGGAVVVMADGNTFRRHGPLEAVLIGSLIPLLLALVVWFALGKPDFS